MSSFVHALCVRTAKALGSRLTFENVDSAGRVLGDVLWYAMPKRRRYASETVERRLGVPPGEAEAVARRSFHNTCTSFLEIFLSDSMGPTFMDDRIEMIEAGPWFELLQNREPAVCVTGHMGCWELLGGLMLHNVGHRPRQVVVRRHRNPVINKAMTDLRSKPGMEVIDHRRASAAVLQGLRNNGASAFLVDHNTMRREAVFLPFLGEVAAVNRGPALLAVRAKAKVWPMCLLRTGGGRYALYSKAPLDTTLLTGSINDRVRRTAEFYTLAIEDLVRRFPDQWMWIHKRWKTRPPDEPPS